MPSATYKKLLVETLPQVIETEKQYREIGDRLGDLAGKGHSRTRGQTRLMRLLGLLVEDYDRRHGMPDEENTPAEKLQFLMEQSGKTPEDLFPIFGQRRHVSEVSSGERKISADQARALGKLFSVKPGLFL